MDIEFFEDIIKDCDITLKSLESLDLYNYESARRRNYNQKCVNKAYDMIYKIKKEMRYQKHILQIKELRNGFRE